MGVSFGYGFVLVFLSFIFPTIPVWIKEGCCVQDSIINLILTLLACLPGLIHSWWVICRTDEPKQSPNSIYVMGPDLEKGQHHQQGGQYVQGQGQYPQQGGHYAQGQGYYDQNQTRTQQPGPTYPPVAHTYAT